MKCQHCRREIGRVAICPYCGARQNGYRSAGVPSSPGAPDTERADNTAGEQYPLRSGRRQERRLANLETMGLLSVSLLGGIFVLELLQLIAMLC